MRISLCLRVKEGGIRLKLVYSCRVEEVEDKLTISLDRRTGMEMLRILKVFCLGINIGKKLIKINCQGKSSLCCISHFF